MDGPATFDDSITQYERGAALTDTVITDITIATNITASVNTIAASIAVLGNQSDRFVSNLGKVDQGLFLVSKLPVVGGLVSGTRAALKLTISPFDRIDDALGAAGSKAGAVSAALDYVTVGLVAGNAGARTAQFILDQQAETARSVRFDQENIEERIARGNAHDDLKATNDALEDYINDTQPARDALAVLDFTAWDLVNGDFKNFTDFLDAREADLGRLSDAIEELFDALEPVEWALDAAQAVQEEVIDPVVNAVLDATGLGDLINDLSQRLTDEIAFLDGFSDALSRITLDLESYDVAGLVGNFWDQLAPAFDIGGPIDLLGNLPVQTFEAENGDLLIIGTKLDDTLIGGNGDDDLVGLGGDDSINGGGGTDRAHYLSDITQTRITQNPNGTITVSSQVAGDADEGTDTLSSIELLRFDTLGLGDVDTQFVSDFLYVAAGAPDLAGDGSDNWLFGDAASNDLAGGAGDDRLFGAAGDDILNGGAGADTVFGGSGDDTITIDVSEGLDIVFGGDGTDRVVFVGSSGVTIDFATGAVASGTDSAGLGPATPFDSVEIVSGTASKDLFLMADGAQTIATGGGADDVLYAGAGDTVTATGGTSRADMATVSFRGGGYDGVRLLHQSDGDGTQAIHVENTAQSNGILSDDPLLFDVSIFEGTDRADVFYGLGVAGNVDTDDAIPFTYDMQTVTGSVMLGGGGTDVFFASEQDNYFNGGAQWDLVNFALDYETASDLSRTTTQAVKVDLETGVATTLAGTNTVTTHLRNIEGIVGSRVTDEIFGNDDANYLSGGSDGHDTIDGRGGDDYIDATRLTTPQLFGGDGNDVFALTATEDATVAGGDGTDTLELSPGQAFRLDAYFDTRVDVFGQDALIDPSLPTFQWDGWQVDLGDGTATSFFGVQNSKTVSPNIYDHSLSSIENVFGSHLDDAITGSRDNNVLTGRGGNDTLSGAQGHDRIEGGAGNDLIFGGEGDDLLVGGQGSDQLDGGAGDDTFLPTGGENVAAASDEDTFTGGDGQDTFVLEIVPPPDPTDSEAIPALNAVPVVTDFDVTQDRVSFIGSDVDPDAIRLVLSGDGTDTALDVVVNGQTALRLAGLTQTDADDVAFIFDIDVQDDTVALTLGQDTPISDLLANDMASGDASSLSITAINGTPVTLGVAASIGLASGAVLEIDAAGALRLNDNDAYDGIATDQIKETFQYEATDDHGYFATANVTLQIDAPLPEAADDSAEVAEDTSIILSPLTNDSGLDLRLTEASADQGTVTILDDARLRYEPDPDFNGDVRITYAVTDARGLTDEGLIDLTVTPVDDDTDSGGDKGNGGGQIGDGGDGDDNDSGDDQSDDKPDTGVDTKDNTDPPINPAPNTDPDPDPATPVDPANIISFSGSGSMTSDQTAFIDVFGGFGAPFGGFVKLLGVEGSVGQATVNDDDEISFTPPDDFVGTANITYRYTNGTETFSDTLSVAVSAPEPDPTPADDMPADMPMVPLDETPEDQQPSAPDADDSGLSFLEFVGIILLGALATML
ncbi:Ig-like domain-containing protein [Yoonia sp. 208BN28-4]|uniref:Ig-like domain-containing protein n=1 Tax=Yoonia sp. 208BN28-4 TaxID=3126505 RepID=UPI0030A7FB1D